MEAITLSPDYVKQTNEAFKELKGLIDSGKSNTSEGKEKMEKMNGVLDKLEADNEKTAKHNELVKTEALELKELVKATNEKDAAKILEQKERIDSMELILAQGTSKEIGKYKESEEFKAFEHLYKTGKSEMIYALPDVTRKALMRTDSNVEGGFLVPTELDGELRKEIVEISSIRSIARVRTMAGKSLEIAIRNINLVATYEGETEADEDSTSKYRNETITPFRQSVTVPFTMDVMMDSAFDIESEIREDVATAFAQGEGLNHITGDGVKKPEGFLQNADIIAGALQGTGLSGLLNADDILILTGQLKAGYNPTFVLNRRTLAKIRTLKGTVQNAAGAENVGGDGQYLWQPALNGQVSATLAGDPYLIAEDMPDVTANAFAIAYGDFRRGYEIFDRTGTMMIRDIYTKKKQAIIELTFMRWNTGRVIIPEAITMLKVKA